MPVNLEIVSPEKLLLSRPVDLANEIVPVAEVSRAEGERRLAEAETAYEVADKTDTSLEDEALDRIQVARAMVEAAQGT